MLETQKGAIGCISVRQVWASHISQGCSPLRIEGGVVFAARDPQAFTLSDLRRVGDDELPLAVELLGITIDLLPVLGMAMLMCLLTARIVEWSWEVYFR